MNGNYHSVPAPQINLHFTDRERSVVRESEIVDFMEQMSKTPFAQHWTLNMTYFGIIDMVTDYVCAVAGCHRRAIQFCCWGVTMLEIAPVCIVHLGKLELEEGQAWAKAAGINRGG